MNKKRFITAASHANWCHLYRAQANAEGWDLFSYDDGWSTQYCIETIDDTQAYDYVNGWPRGTIKPAKYEEVMASLKARAEAGSRMAITSLAIDGKRGRFNETGTRYINLLKVA